MTTAVQLRRGSTTQVAAFTGLLAELVVDTDKNSLVLSDGSLEGGYEIARADFSNIPTNASLTLGTVTATQLDVTATGDLRLQDSAGGQYAALQAPSTISSSYTLTMPAAVGASGQALRAADGSGGLEWYTPADVGDITSVVAGAGLTGGGTSGAVTLNAIGTADRVSVSADAIDIASTYAGQTSITTLGTIATGVWQGTAIANANLANSTVNFGGVTVALGASDTTPAFDLSDATAYPGDSSLVTTGTIATGVWQGTAIANAYLANSTVNFGGVTVALGASDTTPAFNLSDATAYPGDSSLVTAGTIATGVWQGTAVAKTYVAGSPAGDYVGTSDSQTLTNKTLTTPVIGTISNTGTLTLPTSTDTLVGRATTDTLTNKTLTSPVLNGSLSGTAFLDENDLVSNSQVAVASQASIKTYVDSVASGLDLLDSVHVASTAALTVTYANGSSGVGATLTNAGTQAALSIDGQTLVASERVLIKDQAAALQNGIYTVTTVGSGSANWVLTRSTDFDTGAELDSGSFVFVETGTTNADSGYVMTTDGTITIGTTAINWTQFSKAADILAGDGLTKTGSTIDAIGTSNRISVNGNIDIDAAYVGQASITTLGTIGSGIWQGTAIADTYVTDALTISGGTINNTVIGGSTPAAITATTLNVNGVITSDGLTVDGNARIEEIGAIAKLTLERGNSENNSDSAAVDLLETNAGSEGANFGDAATNGFRLKLDGSANDFLIQSGASGTVNTRFEIARDTGAATFSGSVTAKDTSLTGSSSGSTVLTLTSNALADTPLMVFQRTGGAVAGKLAYEDTNTAMSFGTTTAHELKLLTNNTNRLEIDSSGNSTFAGSVSVGNITVDTNTISSTNSNGNIIISPNGTGNVNVFTDVMAIQGSEGEGPSLALQSDDSDDAGDEWRFTSNTDQTLSIKNNISGSEVDYITLTPHATVASSTATFAGGVIVNAGNGNQLTLNNGGERFTQLTLKENGSTQGGLWLDGTDNYVDLYANTSHGIRLKTGGDNTRVTIDENGMMGLGTTPENAFVSYKTFEIGRDFAIYGSTSAQHGGSFSNVYLDAPGNYKRKNEGQSTFLNQIGQYEWYTVAHDAADATITWGTAKMTLTNDGKLGIGVAPTRRKLEVSDASPGIVFRDTGVTGLYHEIVGGGDTGLELWADNGDVSSDTYIRFGVDGQERARIHPGGTLELTVPDSYTTLQLTPTGTNANATLNFNTPGTGSGLIQVQGTTAVTITKDENVGIGTDPGLTRFNVLQDAANWTGIFKNTNSNAYGLSIDLASSSGAGGQADIFALACYTPVNTGFFVLKGGNVGIGTTEPYDALTVSRTSTDQLEGVVLDNLQAGGYGTAITWESRRSDVASTQTAARIYVSGENNWASDANASSAMYFQLRSANTVGTRLAISAAGTFTGSASNDISDQRLKENIQTITDPLTKVKALTGRTFNWKEESGQAPGVKYGFIAQEVESVISDLVWDKSGIIKIKPDNSINQAPMPEDEGEYAKSVQATGIIPILVEAIKELSAKVEALENN